jgi:ribosomal protein S18 acetylase RimI-like enzyme
MEIRDVVDSDWAAAWGFLQQIVAAGDVVETNEHAVRLWESLGFKILATVPEAFRHPERGVVGLHIMHRFLR